MRFKKESSSTFQFVIKEKKNKKLDFVRTFIWIFEINSNIILVRKNNRTSRCKQIKTLWDFPVFIFVILNLNNIRLFNFNVSHLFGLYFNNNIYYMDKSQSLLIFYGSQIKYNKTIITSASSKLQANNYPLQLEY